MLIINSLDWNIIYIIIEPVLFKMCYNYFPDSYTFTKRITIKTTARVSASTSYIQQQHTNLWCMSNYNEINLTFRKNVIFQFELLLLLIVQSVSCPLTKKKWYRCCCRYLIWHAQNEESAISSNFTYSSIQFFSRRGSLL